MAGCMRLRTIRMSEATLQKLAAAAQAAGHRSVSALMRAILDREAADESGPEQRIAATLDQMRQEIGTLRNGLKSQHEDLSALFMLVDSLAKLLATVLPEAGTDARARGQKRYELLLKTAATGLSESIPATLRIERREDVTSASAVDRPTWARRFPGGAD